MAMGWFVPGCFAVEAMEVRKAIDQAEQYLDAAYVTVAEAESAGANVTRLLGNLNTAGRYVSEGSAAFKIGDYENASMLAASCIATLKGVEAEAANMKLDAENVRNDQVVSTAFFSCIGVCIVLVFGIAGWKVLKGRYFREILETKPEAENFSEL